MSFITESLEIYKGKYNYSQTEYKNSRTKVKIICPSHGEFKQMPNDHLKGIVGCRRCTKFGKMENDWLDSMDIKSRQIHIGRYIVDGYDPSTKTIYEFNGDYFHGNPDIYNKEDINLVNKEKFGTLYKNTIIKENYFIENGYNIISMWENNWKSIKDK